jgi:hypothetical protein
MHTRSRHLARKRVIAPRRISPDRLRKSYIYREAADMEEGAVPVVPRAVAAGTFPEAEGTLAAVGMGPRAAAGVETTQEAATGETATAGTMADGNRPGNGWLGSEVRSADPFRTEDDRRSAEMTWTNW